MRTLLAWRALGSRERGDGLAHCAFALSSTRQAARHADAAPPVLPLHPPTPLLLCSYARMKTLRTNKALTGPDMGVPSLTFQAFYEAKHGEAAWASLDKIPREEWMAYLVWYRCVLPIACIVACARCTFPVQQLVSDAMTAVLLVAALLLLCRDVLRLPVRNSTRVDKIEHEPAFGGFSITVSSTAPGSSDTNVLYARKVVLATGIQVRAHSVALLRLLSAMPCRF